MRLRSSRIDLDNHPILEDTTESQNQIYETESPKTPPGQNIEAYFPESPFGRKRYQTNPKGGRNKPYIIIKYLFFF